LATPKGFALLLLTAGCLLWAATSVCAAEPPPVYVISVAGEVDPGLAAYLRRAFRDVPAGEGVRVVLEIDTFGGRVDSALDMVDAILNDAPGETVAYVKTKAISAGALVALACNRLVMRHHTTIGDCAPISYSSEGPKELGEKFQSPLRAKFRALARRNGTSEVLAESMVSAGMEVYEVVTDQGKRYLEARDLEALGEAEKAAIRSKRVVVGADELLTMNDAEAVEFGFSEMSVEGLDELLERLSGTRLAPVWVHPSWSEELVGFISSIAPVLMLIGLAALYIEIKSPGFGVPGLVGILCLGLIFLSQYLVGLADHTEMLLLGLGIVLLGIEVFVLPGFGIAGIAGIVALSFALVLSLQDFVVPDPELPWQGELMTHNGVIMLGAVLGALAVSLATLRYVLPRVSRVVQGPYLEATLKEARVGAGDAAAVQVGDRGIAQTLMRPAGKMRLGSRLLDVVTRGEYIEQGAGLVVAEIRGNTIVVVRDDGHDG
jgi:membrane-bound serine protease (ClpP class)